MLFMKLIGVFWSYSSNRGYFSQFQAQGVLQSFSLSQEVLGSFLMFWGYFSHLFGFKCISIFFQVQGSIGHLLINKSLQVLIKKKKIPIGGLFQRFWSVMIGLSLYGNGLILSQHFWKCQYRVHLFQHSKSTGTGSLHSLMERDLSQHFWKRWNMWTLFQRFQKHWDRSLSIREWSDPIPALLKHWNKVNLFQRF